MFLFGPPNIEKLKAKGDVKGLLKALAYQKDWRVRKAAAEALGQIGDATTVESLIAMLNDSNHIVQKAAASVVGKIQDARAVRPLIAMLKNDSTSIRKAAAEALEQISDARAVEPLIAMLNDRNSDVREAVAKALRTCGWQPRDDIQRTLYCIAIGDWDAVTNIGAAAVEPLRAMLKDPRDDVREAAQGALNRIDPNWDATRQAAKLAAKLISGDSISETHAVAQELVSIGKPAIAVLQWVILTNDKSWAREKAAWALGQIRDPSAIDVLLKALQDTNSGVREYAASALGNLGDPRTVETLVTALKDKSSSVRSAVGNALGEIGKPALEPLFAVLSDPHHIGRDEATYALGKIKDARALEPLLAALKDENRDVRWKAASALGDIGDAQAVEPLIVFFQNRDGFERGIAASALGKLGDARALEPLLAAVKDEKKYVREETAEALGKIGDARAIEPLRDLLKDKEMGVQKKAAEALDELQKKIGGETVRKSWHFLQQALQSDRVAGNWDSAVQQVEDEVRQLSEESFWGYKEYLLSQLRTYQNLDHLFATRKALQTLEEIAIQFPAEKLRKNMAEQVINDFCIYPVWEAGSLTIDSYVPWGDVDYMSHEGSTTMTRLLLKIAARALLWLRVKPSDFVQYRNL